MLSFPSPASKREGGAGIPGAGISLVDENPCEKDCRRTEKSLVIGEVGSLRGVGSPQPWSNRHAAHFPRAVFIDCSKIDCNKLTIFVHSYNRISRKMKPAALSGGRKPPEPLAPGRKILLLDF